MRYINVNKLADMIVERQGGDMEYVERGLNGIVEEDEDSILEFVNKRDWDEYAEDFEKEVIEADYNGEWIDEEEWY